MVAQLTIYSNTSLLEAHGCTASQAKAYFKSKAFEAHQKAEAAQAKNLVGVNERLNGLIRGQGALIKQVAAIRGIS